MTDNVLIERFLELNPHYKEFNGDQLEESDYFFYFSQGFKAGTFPCVESVVQVKSDEWYRYDGVTWVEMTLNEQLEWSK